MAKRVRRLVTAMAKHVDAGSDDRLRTPDFVRLDPDKRSRVVLIDGARGSGKTSVLLHLFQEWNARWRAKESGASKGEYGEFDDVGVIPLRLIDLHPIPRGTHLLMHLVQVFEKVIPELSEEQDPCCDHMGGDGRGAERARHETSLFREARPLASRLRWRALLRTLATGWDEGFLASRRRDLDADAYTIELEEAESERQELHPSHGAFWNFIEALCCDFRERHRYPPAPRRPLFVIGIDDADMNPERARELLQVLQLLVHPRVAFILTGDEPMFYEVVEHRLLKEKDVSVDTTKSLAGALCDKVIPRSQRFKLTPIGEEERWEKLKPSLAQVSTGSSLDKTKTLAALLENDKDLHAVLPQWMRRLTDVKSVLDRGELLPALEALCPVDEISRWGETFVLFRHAKGGFDLRARSRLTWTADRIAPKPVNEGKLREWARAALKLSTEGKSPLSEALGRWLTLVAQVASVHPEARFDGVETAVGPYELGVLEGVRELSEPADAWVSFPWPFPDRANALEVSVFLASWHLPSNPRPKESPEARLLWEYLACVVDTFHDGDGDIRKLGLKELVARVVKMGTDEAPAGTRAARGRRWSLGLAPLLAAPESGLPPVVANEFLALLQHASGARWEARRDRLKRARLERARWALKAATELDDEQLAARVIDAIDQGSPEFEWKKAIDPPMAPPAPAVTAAPGTMIGRLKDALARVRIPSGKHFDGVPEPAVDLTPLIDAIEPFARSRAVNADKPAALAVWRQAVRIAGPLLSRQPDIEDAIHRAVFGVTNFELIETATDPAIELGGLRILAGFPTPRLVGTSGSSRWLDALFKALWDDALRKGYVNTAEIPWALRFLPSVGMRSPLDQSLIGWPVPRWASFSQVEWFSGQWREMYESFASIRQWVLVEKPQRAFVIWFLSRCVSSMSNWEEDQGHRLDLDLGDEKFSKSLGIWMGRTPAPRSGYGDDKWRDAVVPWLCVPESGLTGRAARIIREASGVAGVGSADYFNSRRQGLVARLGDMDRADSVIAQTDRVLREERDWDWFYKPSPEPPPETP